MMIATPTTTIAPAINVWSVMVSSRINQPRNTATTGFTYAYVDTSDVRAFRRSHTYEV
jgi:hypothetical protein